MASNTPSNTQLKYAFRTWHDQYIKTVNPNQQIDFLYSKYILSDDDIATLLTIPEERNRTRLMLSKLHSGQHPEAFIVLRQALIDQGLVYQHLVEKIDACAHCTSEVTGTDVGNKKDTYWTAAGDSARELNVVTGKQVKYVVKTGDNLFALALRFGTTIEKIAEDNQLPNPDMIFPGQTLTLTVDERHD